jgi:hypothetical protein
MEGGRYSSTIKIGQEGKCAKDYLWRWNCRPTWRTPSRELQLASDGKEPEKEKQTGTETGTAMDDKRAKTQTKWKRNGRDALFSMAVEQTTINRDVKEGRKGVPLNIENADEDDDGVRCVRWCWFWLKKSERLSPAKVVVLRLETQIMQMKMLHIQQQSTMNATGNNPKAQNARKYTVVS